MFICTRRIPTDVPQISLFCSIYALEAIRMNKEYISSLIHGAIGLKETEDGLLPVRMTDKQLAVYDTLGGLADGARRCAGMKLCFCTDEKEVRISYKTAKRGNGEIRMDIYEDGIMGESLTLEEEGEAVFVKRSSHETSLVEMYLPYSAYFYIRSISSEKLMPVHKPHKKLLCAGDSITQGCYCTHPSLYYGCALARFLDADLLTFGVGSEIFRPEMLDEDHPFRPDMIVVAYGINDSVSKLTNEEIRENIFTYYGKLRQIYPDAEVYAVSPIWIDRYDPRRPGYNGEEYVKRFDHISSSIADAAREYGCSYINGLELCPHDPSFFADGTVHPNDTGFLLYTLGILKNMK